MAYKKGENLLVLHVSFQIYQPKYFVCYMTFMSQPSSLITRMAVCHRVPLRLTNRNILLVSNLTHLSYTLHPFQPSYLSTLIMTDTNKNAVLNSHPCELNVPSIWTFLFNYCDDIRWEAQITNFKEQNLLRALHVWPIPSVLSLSSEVHKLLSSLFRNSLLSPSCKVQWKLSPLSE